MTKDQAMYACIGVLGGTFDPIHLGHLQLAQAARETLGLEQIKLIPSGLPPHRNSPMIPANERLKLVRIAVRNYPWIEVEASEVEAAGQGQISYTILTLEKLKAGLGRQQDNPHNLVLLLGADAFLGLASWHRFAEILDYAHIAVVNRGQQVVQYAMLPRELATCWQSHFNTDTQAIHRSPAGCIVSWQMPASDISATVIRATFGQGTMAAGWLDEGVAKYIRQHDLLRR